MPRDVAQARSQPGTATVTPAVVALAAVALTVWGATPLVTKVAVGTVDGVTVGLLRPVLSALLALPLALALRLHLPWRGRDGVLLGLSALGGFVIFPVLYSEGVERTSAAHAALIVAAVPVFTGLVVAGVERRLPRRLWWGGVALALAGEALLVGETLGFGQPGVTWQGDVLVIAAGFGAAFGYVAGGKLTQRHGTWAVTFWGLGVAGIAMLPVLLLTMDAGQLAVAGWDAWSAIAFVALASSILAYLCWYSALARGGIARVGAWQFAQPMIGVVLAALILGDAVTLPLIAAAIAIMGGVAICQRS